MLVSYVVTSLGMGDVIKYMRIAKFPRLPQVAAPRGADAHVSRTLPRLPPRRRAAERTNAAINASIKAAGGVGKA